MADEGDAVQMATIAELPAAHLLDQKLLNGWTVVEQVTPDYAATGGHFSFSYYVENRGGERAFLKALNIQAALEGDGPLPDRMKAFFDAYVFERDLLARCRERRMRRVIRLIDHGEVEIPEAGVLRRVPYLILELADGDIRKYQAKLQAFDVAWVLRALKHATLAIEQLHSDHTAHQDLKPSNILTQQDGREMKLGDLGCAEQRGVLGPHTQKRIPGAIAYAPPEQLYRGFGGAWELRCACDLYQLGSLAVQLFLGHNLTTLVQVTLPSEIRWDQWQGEFEEALPYLRKAHAEVLAEFDRVVQSRITKERMAADLVTAISQMTDPEPLRRGHPRNVHSGVTQYYVRRYVSLFNRLARRAEVALMRGAS